jgi:site-specific recombinase XerD
MDWRVGNKRLQRPLNTADWQVAQIRARDMEASGSDASLQPVTVRDATDKFIADAESRGLREPTIRKYKWLFRQLNEYADEQGYVLLSQVTSDHLRDFRQTWKLSSRTAGKHIERLKTFFKFAHDFEWLKKNPALVLKAPKAEESEAVPFSETEMEKILGGLQEYDGYQPLRLKALTLLLLNTGLRIGDAVVITREKFVKDKQGWKVELRTAKTSTEVYCPIPNEVAESVLALPDQQPFWTGASNAEDCASLHRKAFGKLFKQAGVKGHPHQFRHTFAKRLLVKGVPLETVSILLGHSNIKITQRHYNKWVPERQRSLEEAVRKAW